MIADTVLTTQDLTKTYGNFRAVSKLNLRVPRGSISGLLGQNGAGKSTTIRMLLGMVHPTSGYGEVLGYPIADRAASVEIRRRVAYVPEDKRLYDYMSIAQIIRFTRRFFPGWRHDLEKKLLNEFRLPADRKIAKLSKGMRTQVALLLGVCRGCEVLILDEPTEGLDPLNIERVLTLIVGLASEGVTICFSSHQLSEVEQVADYLFMMHHGELVIACPIETVQRDYRRIRLSFENDASPANCPLPGVQRIRRGSKELIILAEQNVPAIVEWAHTLSPAAVEVQPLTLKEVFLENLRPKENSYR
jgi:ABC-2 type transport system ATP-binding protein